MLQPVLRRIRIYVHVNAVNGGSDTGKWAVKVLIGVQLDELALGDANFKRKHV